MAEAQAAHRQQIEKAVVNQEIAASKLGQRGALIVAVVGIAAGSFIAWLGQTVAGTGVIGGTIAAIVTAYVTGTLSRRRERENKAKVIFAESDEPASR